MPDESEKDFHYLVTQREMPTLKEHGVRYLFIDAGYLRREFDDLFTRLLTGLDLPPPEINWSAVMRFANADRAFYYDCFQENDETAELRVQRLREIDALHVRTGKLASRRKRQKQVDVLLAVDMLTHSHLGNTKNAVLLSGDSDFVPLVQAVIQQGTFVSLLYIDKHAAEDLVDAADYRDAISRADLAHFAEMRNRTDDFRYLPRAFEFKKAAFKQGPFKTGKGENIKLWFPAKIAGTNPEETTPHVEMFGSGTSYTLFTNESIANVHARKRACWSCREESVLDRFAEEILGPIRWQHVSPSQ